MSGYVVRHPRDVKPGDLVDVFPAGEPIPVPPPAIYGHGQRYDPAGLASVPEPADNAPPPPGGVMHCESCRCDQ